MARARTIGLVGMFLVTLALGACVGDDPPRASPEDGGASTLDGAAPNERDADATDGPEPIADAALDGGQDGAQEDDAGDGAAPKTGDVLWAVRFGGTGDETWSRVAFAPNGDVIFAFAFDGAVTIGTTTTFQPSGTADIAVLALDAKNGAPKWSKRLTGTKHEAARALAVDPNGNIYVSQRVVTPDPATDCAVTRLDASGNLQWSIFGSSSSCAVEALVADANAVYAPFYFVGGINPGQGMTSAGDFDGVFVRFDSLGNLSWARKIGGAGRDLATGVALAGDLFFAATISSTVTFPGGAPLTASGGTDLALARYDTAGNHVFSRRFGGSGDERSTGIASDGDVIAMTGTCSGTTNLGGADLTCGAPSGPFVAVYDAKSSPPGAHLFARALSASGNAQTVSVTQGDVIVSGWVTAPVDFGAGSVSGIGGTDSFVARYAASGAVVWAKLFGSSDDDLAASHVTAADGRTFVTGDFRGTATFGNKTLTSAGGIDSYVVALAP